MDFHTVKTSGVHRIARGRLVAVHDAGQLTDVKCTRLGSVHKTWHTVLDQHGFGFGSDGRWRHRLAAVGLQIGVRDTAHMPELHHNLAALRMHGFGHFLPAVELFGAVQTGYIRVALGLVADGGGFGDQQTGAGALRIVGLRNIGRNGVGRTVARERRHDDAVGKLQVAGLVGVEQGGHG